MYKQTEIKKERGHCWSRCNHCLSLFGIIKSVAFIWVLLFSLAFMRYELKVFRAEERVERIQQMVDLGKAKSGASLALLMDKNVPVRPVFFNPISIIRALDPQHDVAYDLPEALRLELLNPKPKEFNPPTPSKPMKKKVIQKANRR